MREANKAIVLRNYEELTRGNLNVIDELYAEDFVGHFAGLPPVHGREAMKGLLSAYFSAFPDMHQSREDLIAEGNRVVIRVACKATHNGEFQGVPPSGRVVQFRSTDIYRLADGKIAEWWNEYDTLGMMQQVGAIPVAPSAH